MTTQALARLEAIGRVLSFQQSLAASQKVVNIEISAKDLTELKASNYRLCFAKKVGDADYNVVWQSYDKFLINNQFSWTPMYQMFGTNTFQDNITVKASTNTVTIGLGQTSILSTAGVLGPAFDGGPPISFVLDNQYGSIHPGVNQLSTGIDGSQTSTPIYVAPKRMVSGKATLTPVEKVLVWFEQNIETSTMFSSARSNQVEIDLTAVNTATRRYADQKWTTPIDG